MRRKLAQMLRAVATWLDPLPVEVLLPRARHLVAEAEQLPIKGPFKQLTVAKQMRREALGTTADINLAIELAVREFHAGHQG